MTISSSFTPLNTYFNKSLPPRQAYAPIKDYNKHTKDKVSFSGAEQSKQAPVIDKAKAESEFYTLLQDSHVSEKLRGKAIKKYENLKKEVGREAAIKSTCNWLFGIDSGSPLIHGIDHKTIKKTETLLAVAGDKIGNAIAWLPIKDNDKKGETFLDKAAKRWMDGYQEDQKFQRDRGYFD